MSHITIPTLDASPAASKPTLNAIHKQLGTVPNFFRLLGNSPTALSAFTGFQSALTKSLDLKTRERIAIAVAQENGCNYCLSAHTYLGLNLARISPEEIALNRSGSSLDARASAAVHFAQTVARERGHIDEAEINRVREAGYTDAEIIEIVALVVENTFSNYLNEVAQTDIDFPEVQSTELQPTKVA